MRAGEQELPRVVPALVDPFLYVEEEFRRPLDLVEDHRRRMAGQERSRVFGCDGANVGQLQRNVPVVASGPSPEERSLARLSRSGDDDCRKLRGGLGERRFEGAADVLGHDESEGVTGVQIGIPNAI